MADAPRSLPANRRIRGSSAPGVIDAPGEEVAGATQPERRNARSGGPLPHGRGSVCGAGSVGGPARAPWFGSFLRRLQPIVGLIVVVAASIAVAWGIRHHVMTSPRFGVRTVRVEGTVRRNPEQVAASGGLQIGKNIFSIDLENARVLILQDPWIERAQVKRKLPSTIMVEVAEREASAAVAVGNELYLCTHEGELFKRLESGDPSNLVVMTGLLPDDLAKDRVGATRRVRAALELMIDYEQRGPSKRLPLQEIHLVGDGTMRMVVGKDAVTLEMGAPPYRQKVLRAARVLEEVDRRHAQPSVVFLDNVAHPERVVVRMR